MRASISSCQQRNDLHGKQATIEALKLNNPRPVPQISSRYSLPANSKSRAVRASSAKGVCRILYVPFVFDPDQWRVLPPSNPAAPNTRDRFRVLRGGSVRYRFERQ